jgi:hypothetical protein
MRSGLCSAPLLMRPWLNAADIPTTNYLLEPARDPFIVSLRARIVCPIPSTSRPEPESLEVNVKPVCLIPILMRRRRHLNSVVSCVELSFLLKNLYGTNFRRLSTPPTPTNFKRYCSYNVGNR